MSVSQNTQTRNEHITCTVSITEKRNPILQQLVNGSKMRGEDDDGFGDVGKSSSGTTTPRPWVAVPAFMPAIGRMAT